MANVDARLLSLLCGGEPAAVEARLDVASGCRGLFTTRDVVAGSVLLRLPWAHALSVQTAVRRLAACERAGVPLTALPLRDVLTLCESPSELLPRGCGWSLLLALQLLAELRDPRSPHAAYVATLPAPEGSALAAIARGPPAGAHLSLATPAQLRCLACPALEAGVLKERQRQRRLHAQLFGTSDPAVSFASFSWANCLVASRAVGLSMGSDARTASLRCLLPAIDLCNHAARSAATASLRLQTRALQDGTLAPMAVELFSTRALAAGDAVMFDYGTRLLRHWCAAYGFVPDSDAQQQQEELFEEITTSPGEPGEALLVESNCGLLRLTQVRLLAHDAGGAAVCYVVSDADAAHAARFVMPAEGDLDDGDKGTHALPPGHEAALSRLLSERAREAALQLLRDEQQHAADARAADEQAATPLAPLSAQLRAARARLLLHAAEQLAAQAVLLE